VAGGALWVAWVGISACAHHDPGIERRGEVLAGTPGAERLLALGDPVGAAQLLRKAQPSDAGYAYAQELLGFASTQADAIARQWITELDGLVWEERYGDARTRAVHLLDEFPLAGELRDEVERRLHEIEQGLTLARANLEELDRQAEELLMMGSLVEAVPTLEEAFVVARQIGAERLYERERVLMALRLRSAGAEGFGASVASASTEPPAAKRSGTSRKRAEAKATSGPTTPSTPAVTMAVGPPASDAATSSKVRRLLANAARYLKGQAYFNAIVAYLKVRELEPQNAEAPAALEDLEPHRQVLISDLVDNANRRFLNQDLEGAEPYFRKVLLIDPFNEQAVQGLQMFENLKRIRNEAGAKTPNG
ncbi:MAG: hypothetical protein AAB426_03950, partial [Myxococcota bacterium]